MVRTLSISALIGVSVMVITGCQDDPIPRPRGYFRIDLPEQRYLPYQGTCPFTAEVPWYAMMTRPAADSARVADTTCWVDLRFPQQHASFHMTYRKVDEDLAELIADAHAFKSKHEVKAARIRSERIVRPEAGVYGNFFAVEGDVASPAVFYLTDSSKHFLYGALYFDARPNADSLGPVTDRIRQDLRHLAGTLSWR